jgi:PilZ domain-containing protein
VLIGASNLLAALKQRAGEANGEVLTFPDSDALGALKMIIQRRPTIVALDRGFAVTPRGAALINRIKIDPSLKLAEIRVLAHDSDYTRVIPRTVAPTAPGLDQRGTRRAPRFNMADRVEVVIEGKSAILIDLSTVGAQVVAVAMLKPNQRISVALTDDVADVRLTASVSWTKFEIPPDSGPRYRAGIDFVDADAPAVDAFCLRHRA